MKITNILFFINLLCGFGFSIISPLFPSIATQKGITESLIGWVIGIFSLSNIFIAPFIPLLIKKFTRIKLLYFSTFLEATCIVLYSFISFLNSFYGILIYMFIIRIIHGCCCGIIGTLIYSLTISLSKRKEVKKSLGNLEIGWCIGIILGPILASVFYKLGGYPLPFIIIGFILYISVFLANKVSQEKTESNEKIDEDPPLLKFFTYGEIIFILGTIFFGCVSESFYYPCLTNHLEKNFGLSIDISSLFFIIIACSNVIILQFLDSITRIFGLYGTSCIGLILVSIGVLLIYPYPPIPKSIIFVVIGFILIGCGDIQIFIPGLVSLNKSIKRLDPNFDDLMANDITSAINFLILNTAGFCAPIIGGFFSTHLGFKNCCLIISCILLFYCLVYFIYFYKLIFEDFEKKGRRESSFDTENKLDENELINHPGLYKENNINNIISQNENCENFIMRKNIYCGIMRKEEESNKLEYISLEGQN